MLKAIQNWQPDYNKVVCALKNAFMKNTVPACDDEASLGVQWDGAGPAVGDPQT